MILTGIGDEGANSIDGQILATQELGWKHLEPRGVEVPGYPKANIHDLPDEAFDLRVDMIRREKLTMRTAALTMGIKRVQEAKRMRGLFP